MSKSKFKITYIKSYVVNADSKDHAIGISDEMFQKDIREYLGRGENRIIQLFGFFAEGIEK